MTMCYKGAPLFERKESLDYKDRAREKRSRSWCRESMLDNAADLTSISSSWSRDFPSCDDMGAMNFWSGVVPQNGKYSFPFNYLRGFRLIKVKGSRPWSRLWFHPSANLFGCTPTNQHVFFANLKAGSGWGDYRQSCIFVEVL